MTENAMDTYSYYYYNLVFCIRVHLACDHPSITTANMIGDREAYGYN